MGPLALSPGVAISGMVYTANLGIMRIVANITSNPAIRFLFICGRDSQLFKPGQSLVSLADQGVDNDCRIKGALGYDPVLQNLTSEQISFFRKQVEVIDWNGEEDIEKLKSKISELAARNPGPFATEAETLAPTAESFTSIRPGGQREPLLYDPKGYFVITIDRDNGEIVLRHYLPNHKPAHEMKGRGATSMLLGLLRDGLITQLSHAGYLGEELAKAQTALQFGLRYDQDRPLQQTAPDRMTSKSTSTTNEAEASNGPKPGQMASGKMKMPLTIKEFETKQPASVVDFALLVENLREDRTLSGNFLNMDEANMFSTYHRTTRTVEVHWSPSSKIIMGQENEIQKGALLRIAGKLEENNLVSAEQIVILTRVAQVADSSSSAQ